MKPETVAAVVVTYNRAGLLSRCLDALLSQSRPLDAIYVVDNASTDGTADMIARQYAGRVTHERRPENTGSSGGCHYGMKRAYEEGHDWIWLMDDDTAAHPNCLETLLLHQERALVLVPLRLTPDHALAELACLRYDLRNPFLRSPKDRLLCWEYGSVGELPDTVELKEFSFEGPLFSRRVVDGVGLPRPDMFIYGDDTEYSLRIRRCLGEQICCVRDAWMFRTAPDGPPGRPPAWRLYYGWRNDFFLLRRYGENVFVRFKPVVLVLETLLRRVLKGGSSAQELKLLCLAFVDSYRRDLPRRILP